MPHTLFIYYIADITYYHCHDITRYHVTAKMKMSRLPLIYDVDDTERYTCRRLCHTEYFAFCFRLMLYVPLSSPYLFFFSSGFFRRRHNTSRCLFTVLRRCFFSFSEF